MAYLPLPLDRLLIGRGLPVDVRAPDGRLLLRRGQSLQSEAHRDMLASHHACMTETDAKAWQRALERQMRVLRQNGADMSDIATTMMPAEILESDFIESRPPDGGWMDLQVNLRSLLYQGANAATPLPRIEGIVTKALTLLSQDPDDSLFVLFQALPDLDLGYCATHALLSGAIGVLTAAKLELPPDSRDLLLRSALVMNIAMARQQDSMACQLKPPTPGQRELVNAHGSASAEILRSFGAPDPDWIDTVHWHHAPEQCNGPAYQKSVVRLLNLADSMVAKMAPRLSRVAMSTFRAAKSLVLESDDPNHPVRHAMASILGFYPPGTYVRLTGGELAVVIARGDKATSPHVACLTNAKGLALGTYVYRDTRKTGHSVQEPVDASQVNITVNQEKIRRLRQQHVV